MLWNLKAEVARRLVKCIDLANLLGVRPATISLKIRCKSQFSFDKAQDIQINYFPDLELQYLFKEGR